MRHSGRSRQTKNLSRAASFSRPKSFRPGIEGLEERTVLSLFTVAPSIFLGNNTAPQSVTSADFRGNGRLDLAVADHGTNAVSVLLSNGDGTYQAAVNYNLGANMKPSFLTSANLNADSRPDLVVVDNATPGFVSVLLNNGDGTFAAPVNYAVGNSPCNVAVADMNGDTVLDLIVANKSDNSLTVLLNQGNGTFVAQAAFTVPAAPVSITAGDFNNDNKNDVALVAGSNVYVYNGTGSGTLQTTPATLAAGTFPGLLSAGHFHDPNKLDLAVVDVFPSSTGVAILLNDGTGSFAAPVQYDLGASPNVSFAGATPNSLAIGDLNGDNKMDLAVANGQFANNGVSVLLGNGDGTFGGLTSWVADQQPAAVVIGNFLGDTKADMVVVNQGSNDVSFLLGNGDGTFAAPPTIAHINSPGPVVTGDFNGDSNQDVIVGNTFSLNGVILTTLVGNGDGTFKTPTTILNTVTNPTTGQAKILAAAQMNAGSALDLIVLDSKNKLDVFLNNGSGGFAAPVSYSAGTNPTGMAVGDFNGDGKPDVAIVNSATAPADGTAMIYLNDGTGALTLVGTTPDIGLTPTGVFAADLDGDGKDDLAVANNNGFSSTVSVLISAGSGAFQAKVPYAVDGHPTAVAAAPLRAGGKPDLAVSTFFGVGMDVLLNNGDGTFGASKPFATGSNPVAITINDVTRDGIPDVESTNNFGDSLTVWVGLGDGNFAQTSQTFTVGDRPSQTAAADFNSDGFLDLVTTNGNANDITFLLTGAPAATNSQASGASATYSIVGQQVNLSATITSLGAVVNEGTETFALFQGGTPVGTPVTVSVVNGLAGAAYALPAGLPAGVYQVQASYHGTATFASSVDSTQSVTIGKASSTTAGSSASATFKSTTQNVNLTASVLSPAGPLNEGTETFTLLLSGVTIGTPVTANVINGVASATYALPAGAPGGTYTLQVDFNGSTNISGSTDSGHTLTIGAATTTTAGSSAIATFSGGAQNVSLNATVASAAGVVNEGTETFTVFNGATPVGSPVTVNVANGMASASYALPAGTTAGTYTIKAVYTGDANLSGSADSTHSLTVGKASTSTAAAAVSTTFGVSSHTVTLQAAIASGSGAVSSGTATFTVLSGAITIGSPATANVTNGAASVNYSLPAGTAGGTYIIQVAYSGDSNLVGSSDNTQSLTVNAASTNSIVSNASAAFSSGSQNVTLNVSVVSGAGTVNEGTETFTILQAGTAIGSPVTVNVSNGAAGATYTLPAGTSVGAYQVQAKYNGTANFGVSTDISHTLTVGAATTSTSAAIATIAFSSAAHAVSLTATVTSPGGVVSEGTETFTLLQGATTIGTPITANVAAGAASASYSLPAGLAVGTYTIKAVFVGAGSFAGSSDSSHSLTVASTGQVQFTSTSFSASESDPTAAITVTRTGGSFGPASVSFATGGGTAPAGTDYTATTLTVNWAAGEQGPKTVSIPLINHNATDASTETVGLTLSTATGAALGTPSAATLTIQETPSNALPSQLNFSVALARVARNAGNAVLTVVRSGGLSGTVTVQVATSDGTAVAGTDYTAETATLTFGPNVTAQTVSIALLNNSLSGGKTINIALSNAGGGAVLLTPSSLVLTITDPLPIQPIPANLGAIASAFTHDAEPLSIFVTGAYHLYLKRLPDSQGLTYWIDQLQHQGMTDEKLETGFLSSAEYIQNHGGTGQAWVIGMYQDLLGRNPDPGGLTYWAGVLVQGGSAFSVALGFAASAEREGQRIAGDYQIFLGRQLDANGQAFWVQQFLGGARNEDVVAGFVGSQEYYQNQNKGQSNRTAWIDSAFQDIYHRDPTSTELAMWLNQMS
jgi:hypothetical protein